MKRRLLHIGLLALLIAAALLLAAVWHINYRQDAALLVQPSLPADDAGQLQRGAYLARIGNCMACHTARGGTPAAGGRPIATPFGTLYASNLTPDEDTGIGRWSLQDFRQAMHRGRSANGRLLYPAFPYTHTTAMARADMDALYAYFRSLPPERAQPPAHELRWPYSTQAALAIWRTLYFRPAPVQAEAPAEKQQLGPYLVHAVAHCSACHTARDRLGGGNWQQLSGGLIPGSGWYAPSLLAADQAGLQDWSVEDISRLLLTGTAPGGSASGPMAEVVLHATQYLSEPDAQAMASHLRQLPAAKPSPRAPSTRSSIAQSGDKLYQNHCASCHGERGEGIAGAYPPLAGNRAVTMAQTENLLQTLLYGGYGPATAGHPRPFGMPPFALSLSDTDIAAVLSHIRTSWGNQAGEVSPLAVHQMRAESARALQP